MNKNSIIFIIIGLAIIVGLVFLLNRPESTPSYNTNQTNNPTPPAPPPFFEIVLDYKTASPTEVKSFRIEQGQKVRVKTTADIADEVHVHGYDISVDVKPGEQAVLEFTADKTGRFPIELEEIKKDIAVIEVYPK